MPPRITLRIFALLGSAGLLASGQVLSPLMGQNAEFQHLYERVSGSTIVAWGKVIERKPVWKRGVPPVAKVGPDQYRTAKIEEITGGARFTIELSGPVCKPQGSLPARLHIFVPDHAERFSDVVPGMRTVPEQLFTGKEYLLFVSPWPRQSELQASLELDAQITYYRVFDGFMGARESPGPPVVSAVTALCGALAPPDVAQKLSRLRALQATADPRWKASVDAAIRDLEAHPSPAH